MQAQGDDIRYPDLSPLQTALTCRCPRCGRGALFSGYLALAPRCTQCGLSYDFADAGDGAAWFVMLVGCVLGVGSILAVEVVYSPSVWVHITLAIPILIVLPLLLLRPAKAFLVNQQWKMGAAEGRLK